MKVITIKKGDLVETEVNNNAYQYAFPRGSVTFQDHEIALDSVNLFYNWYNIRAELGNNIYYYTWIDGSPENTVEMPDGNYTVEQFNHFLEWTMITNKHYLIDGSGNYVYYLEWLRNPTSRLLQLISYPVPATTTYSLPPGATWSLPATDTTPQVRIDANNVRTLTGFTANTYPIAQQSTIYTTQGSTFTSFQPIVALNIECQLLYNNLSLPSTLLYTIAIPSVEAGTLITAKPTNYAFSPIKDGQYTDMLVRLTDQNGVAIKLQDPNLTMGFVVRSKGEMV